MITQKGASQGEILHGGCLISVILLSKPPCLPCLVNENGASNGRIQ